MGEHQEARSGGGHVFSFIITTIVTAGITTAVGDCSSSHIHQACRRAAATLAHSLHFNAHLLFSMTPRLRAKFCKQV